MVGSAGESGQQRHAVGSSAAEVEIAGELLGIRAEFLFCLFQQFYDFFRTFPKENSFFREGDLFFPTDQQLLSQFPFQLHQLFGERRLCHMQTLCGAGDIFLFGHSQKITHYSDIQNDVSLSENKSFL